MVRSMLAPLRRLLRRFLSDRIKGLVAWAGSGLWWLADKTYGEAVFAWITTVVSAQIDPETVRAAWTYGPPLFLMCLGAYFFWRAERRPVVAAAAPSASAPQLELAAQPAPSDPPIPIERAVYVGRVHIDDGKLESDFLLEFAFIAFNGNDAPVQLAGLQGRIAYAKAIVAPETDWVTLPPATIREDNLTTFGPYAEFLVVVSQRVPGALAAEIVSGFSSEGPMMFVLEKFDIALTGADADKPARLPLWERITFERAKTIAHVGRIALLRSADSVKAT